MVPIDASPLGIPSTDHVTPRLFGSPVTVAENCWVCVLTTTEAFRGLMLTDTDGWFTVSSVLQETVPTVAVIVLVPGETPLPGCGLAAAPTVATAGVPLFQVACAVTSFCELSL